jgi:sigma-B regulation protein RsbU (phosphoserine phosphatase)
MTTPGGSVLVVEDNHESLRLLTNILMEEGYTVRPADSGKLALASIAASQPQLVLLDINMPEMDGFEVLRRLKASTESRNIPVVFISGSIEVEKRTEGLEMGAVDFISKPFHREELLARVRTHLELSQLRGRLEQQNADLMLTNAQLQEALASVKILRGLIPICASCKKIRDDGGFWHAVESYISEHSEAAFSHGICPDCLHKLYPEHDLQ